MKEMKLDSKPTIRIIAVDDNRILFSDYSEITYYHDTECCEHNYADFKSLDDEARAYDFQTPIRFEAVDRAGFRFGDARRMFFVPCYTEQNGYYTDDIEIYYKAKQLGFHCKAAGDPEDE